MMEWIVLGCVVVLFTAYHMRLWWKARQSDEPNGPTSFRRADKTVSFLVPAWNAAGEIPAFVQSFQRLSYQNKQLIVCAGGNDGTHKIMKSFESDDILVLEQPKGYGKQKALHLSLPHATGEVIFLTDIDCELQDATVEGLVSGLSDEYPVATGSIRPREAQRQNPFVVIQWAIRAVSCPRHFTETAGLLGANTALLRSALEDIGGFSKDVSSGTDYTLAKELRTYGHKIAYVPNCEMSTEFPATLRSYIQKQTRWLRNILVIAPKYKAWREVLTVLVTIALPFVYIILFLLGFFLPFFWALIIMMLLHATLNRLRFVRMMKRRVRVGAAFFTVIGDLYAAARAGYQWIRKNYAW